MKTTNNKFFAVRYISGNDNSEKYIGSISDYQDGGFADPILMTRDEAQELYDELTAYVEAEYIGKTDEDNEQAHYAFRKGEWGFVIEVINLPVLDDEEEEVGGKPKQNRKHRRHQRTAKRIFHSDSI